MIFITVGTHEQPFNRVIEYVDNLKRDGIIQDEVFMQLGYSTYKPQYCAWSQFLSYDEMKKKVIGSRIVVTHGGPASFIMPLQASKIPIVVPRQKQYNEHVNNHQVEFVKKIEEGMQTIIAVYDIDSLKNIIINYDKIVLNMKNGIVSNNSVFNGQLGLIVEEMFCEKTER